MKPQKKAFVVEIKNRRSAARQHRSIWGNIDLSQSEQIDDGESKGDSGGDSAYPSSKGTIPARTSTPGGDSAD